MSEIEFVPCPEWEEKLADFHARRLSSADQVALEAHLAWCQACATALLEYRRMDGEIRRSLEIKPLPTFTPDLLQARTTYGEPHKLHDQQISKELTSPAKKVLWEPVAEKALVTEGHKRTLHPPEVAWERDPSLSTLLGALTKKDHSEIVRIAREIGVSDKAVYRWLNGTLEPQPSHVRRLQEVLPPTPLLPVVPPASQDSALQVEHQEISNEFYRRVLDLAATIDDDDSRGWHIISTIFEYALLRLDPERRGMALTYARLMPPRADGSIHSLREAQKRGSAPFAEHLEHGSYLGSTTLAGTVAMSQRLSAWSRLDEKASRSVSPSKPADCFDDNVQSSCASPVMRGGRLAGVLIVSSTQRDFIHDALILKAVDDYAHLLACGLMDSEFYPISLVKLVPMPELKWQREQIRQQFVNKVLNIVRKQRISRTEAEQQVQGDLEDEFERFSQDLAAGKKKRQDQGSHYRRKEENLPRRGDHAVKPKEND